MSKSNKYIEVFLPFQNVVQSKKGLFKSTQSQSTSQGSIPRGKYFGQPINTLSGVVSPPNFLVELMDFLAKNQVNASNPGIFKISGNREQMNEVFDILNDPEEEDLELSEMIEGMEGNVYTVADLVKEYFLMTPEPLFTYALFDNWTECKSNKTEELYFKDLKSKIVVVLNKLNPGTLSMMKTLFLFLNSIKGFSHVNQMNSEQLSLVFTPIVLRPQNLDLKKFKHAETACKLVEFFIEYADNIF